MVGEYLYFHDTALQRVSTSGALDGWMPIPAVYCYAVNERTLVLGHLRCRRVGPDGPNRSWDAAMTFF